MARDELEEVLMSLGGVFDGDEPVDELSHALQCARHAQLAAADPELIVAALFHDVARSPLLTDDFPGIAHEAAAAVWLQPRFGDRVAWIAGAHVAAKLHLLETEPRYREQLSDESARSAVHQGAAPHADLRTHLWWPDAVQLRRWDDAAKNPETILAEPEELLHHARSLLRR